MTLPPKEMELLLSALTFAALKHSGQRRKDSQASPYINHPIQVAETLCQVGKVYDIVTIIAALLHDTLEDTDATPDEIRDLFGQEVLDLVKEVTDDKTLPKEQRKRLQIEHASHHSARAKQLKLADKICNVHDITYSPPADWSLQRCLDYLTWSEQVVKGLRGVNQALENNYDAVLAEAKYHLTHFPQT